MVTVAVAVKLLVFRGGWKGESVTDINIILGEQESSKRGGKKQAAERLI